MSSQQTQPDDLSADLDKILEKAFSDIRKRVSSLIAKREKQLSKQYTTMSKTSKKPPVKTTEKKKNRKYYSSSSDSED